MIVVWTVGELQATSAFSAREFNRRLCSAFTGRYDGVMAFENRDALLARDAWGGEL